MKKLALILGGVILILFWIASTAKRSDNSNRQTAGLTESTTSNNEALAAVKAEAKVKDAVITEAGVLYVGVLDDGTRRDGYAEYLCQLLKDHKSNASRVKVVRFGSQNSKDRDNAYGVLLGESWCR